MNWRLTREAIDGPKLQDWSEWRIMDESEAEPRILDMLYEDLVEQGQADGVLKIRDGVYLGIGGGWVF